MNDVQKENYLAFKANERREMKEIENMEKYLVYYAKFIKGLSTQRLLRERRYYFYCETNIEYQTMKRTDEMVYEELTKREHVPAGPEKKNVRRVRNDGGAILMRNVVPHELVEALKEYFERHPEKAEIVVHSSISSVRMGDLPDEITRGTKVGIDYEKALYKMAFEDLIDGRKQI